MEGAQETSVSTCSFIPKELSAEQLSESEFITNGLFTENDEDTASRSSNSKEVSGLSSPNNEEEYEEMINSNGNTIEEHSKLSSDEEWLCPNEYIFQDFFARNGTLTSEEFAEKILYLTDIITKEREEKYKIQKQVRTLIEERRLQAYDLEEMKEELLHCKKEKQNYFRQVEMLQQEKLYFKSRLDEQIEKGSQDSDSHWSLQNEVKDLQMRLQDMEQEAKEANQYAANLKTKLDKKAEEVMQLKAKENAYHEKEETLRKERDALIRSNAEAVQTVEQLRNTWNSVQEQLRMEVSRRKTQENEFRMRTQEMEQKSRKLKEENDNLKFALQNLENLLEEKQLACDNNQQLIDNYETQIVSFNEELKQLKDVRNSLQQQIIETKEQLQERDEIIEKLQATLENKSRRCDDLERTTNSLQERQDELLNKIRTLQEECGRLRKDKEYLSGLREKATAQVDSYAAQLESAEEQRRQLEEQLQNLQNVVSKLRTDERKLRVKCENQKQLLDEYERQLEKNSNLHESALFQQIGDLLDQKLSKLDESGEQKSVILQLADKVQQLCDERDEMIAIIDHMKHELDAAKQTEQQFSETDWKDQLEEKEREIALLEARLKQTNEEKTFAENELRLLQKEMEQIRGYNSLDASDISLGKLSTSFSEQSLQKILKAFDNLVYEKKILSHKNKELNERLRVTLESRELDEETTRSLLKESQTIQQQLCGIISAHESVLHEMKEEPLSSNSLVYKNVEEDKENRDMNSSTVSACDEPLIKAMNTHIFQLRNMWLHELDNNAELRRIIVDLHQRKKLSENICHRGVQSCDSIPVANQVPNKNDKDDLIKLLETIDDLKNRNACLEENVEEYKTKLEESSGLVTELRAMWHSWVQKLYEMLPWKEAVEDEMNIERICVQVSNYLKWTVHKLQSLSEEISALEKENKYVNDCVMNLKTQKSLFLYALEKNNIQLPIQLAFNYEPKERLKSYFVTLLGLWRLCSSLLGPETSGMTPNDANWYYLQAPQCAKSFDNKKEMENAMNSALVPRLQNEIAHKNKVIHQLERRIASLQEKRRQELGEKNESGDIPYKSLRMMLEEKDGKLKQGQQVIDRLKAQKEKLQLQITNISKELESLAASESRERFAKESAESRIQILNKRLQNEMKKVEALKKELHEREKKFQDTVAQLLAKTEESFSSDYGSTGAIRQSPRFSPAFNSPPVKESSSMKKKSPRNSSQKTEENTKKLKGSSLISQFHQVSDSKGAKNTHAISSTKNVVDDILSSAEASLSKAKNESTEESVQELREHIQELRNASMKLMSKSTMSS